MNENQKESTRKFVRLFVSFIIGCGLIFIILSLATYFLKQFPEQ